MVATTILSLPLSPINNLRVSKLCQKRFSGVQVQECVVVVVSNRDTTVGERSETKTKNGMRGTDSVSSDRSVHTTDHIAPSLFLTTYPDSLLPVTREVGSALQVKIGVVRENASLLDVALVVVVLLLLFGDTDLLVLGLGQASRDVRVVRELANLEVLLATGAVVVLLLHGSEQVHAEDTVGEGVAGNRDASVGRSRGKGRSRSDEDKGGGGGDLHVLGSKLSRSKIVW